MLSQYFDYRRLTCGAERELSCGTVGVNEMITDVTCRIPIGPFKAGDKLHSVQYGFDPDPKSPYYKTETLVYMTYEKVKGEDGRVKLRRTGTFPVDKVVEAYQRYLKTKTLV